MAVLDALRRMSHFTQAEKNLAAFILEHLDEVSRMKIGELAEASFTSTATVVRLCRKLGVDGYRDFRVALAREVELDRANVLNVNPDYPFLEGANTQQVIRSVAALTKQAVDASAATVNAHDVRVAARLVRSAGKVALYAVGDSSVTTEGFANLLLKIGIVTYSGNLNGDSMVATQILGPGDVAVVVSYSGGLLSRFEPELRLLRARGCKVVLVTSNAEVARRIPGLECLLLLPEGETTRGSLSTYYSQSCIRFALNCVYGECFAQGWDESVELRRSFAEHDVYPTPGE